MAQKIKALVFKPDESDLMTGKHIVEEENLFL